MVREKKTEQPNLCNHNMVLHGFGFYQNKTMMATTTAKSSAIIVVRKRKQINDLKWHMLRKENMLTVDIKTRNVLIATSDFIYISNNFDGNIQRQTNDFH